MTSEVALVGLGVIGGSVALRLRERGTALRAWSASDTDRRAAAEAGVSVCESLAEACRDAQLVLLAVPLDAIINVAREAAAAAAPQATILHAASLQSARALGGDSAILARLIGTHPLAGSHASGFTGARAGLFQGATVYVERRASARQREDAELFWSLAGAARTVLASAEEHDAAMAWYSHLPQLCATALAGTLASSPIAADARFAPGPGARDTTRLAMSTLEMWRPLLAHAPRETLDALDAFAAALHTLRASVAAEGKALDAPWQAASDWRRRVERAGEMRERE